MANSDEKTAASAGGREVYLLGEINAERMKQISSDVIRLWREKPKEPIMLMLNSAGGDVDPAIAFCEVVQLRRIPLEAIVFFSADSAAIAILCSCRKRRATPSSTFLFHSINKQAGGARLTEKDFKFHAEDLAHSTRVYCKIIARATGHKPEEIAKLMEAGTALDAKAAKRFGLIHQIIRM